MRKLFGFMSLLIFSGLALAEDGAAAAAGNATPFFSKAISMGIAAGICALGQGKVGAAACEGIARNPGAAGNIRTTMIIALALIESLALYTLVVVFAA